MASTIFNEEELEKWVDGMMFGEADKVKPTKHKAPEVLFNPVTDGGASTTITPNTTTKKYSELFGWDADELKGMDDFDAFMYEDAYWTADDLLHVPDVSKFDNRVVDHRAMYPFVLGMQPKFRAMKIMLVGPTGSGKSTLAEYFCAKINQPFLRINGRQDMESDSIIGKPWVTGGSMEFQLGEWPKATQKGWFVLVDEPWKIPSGIMMTAQRHMERGGIWQLDDIPSSSTLDKQIVPKPSYRCVFADNVVGTGDNTEQYGATMIQDSSTLNRIDMVIKVDYLPPKEEVNVVTSMFPAIPKPMADKMIAMLNLLRGGFNSGELSSPASLRNIEAWGEMAVTIGNYEQAFKWVLLERYADDDEKGAVRNHYNTCFGRSL